MTAVLDVPLAAASWTAIGTGIRLVATIIPFVSSYEPFWLGLGAVSLDLSSACG
jgi:hypothetical protein